MEVTSRELREGNIRDALRGYNHDDVDELLERAAITVDNLHARIGELTDRLTQIEQEASRGRDTEEQLSRALLAAQRTADEMLEEARENARRVVEEAEQRAKDEVEEESQRLRTEVLQLAATREALDADVSALTEFAENLAARLREALESQLAALEARSVDASGRPALAEVELPVTSEEPEPEGAETRDDVDADPTYAPDSSERSERSEQFAQEGGADEPPEGRRSPEPTPLREPASEHHSPLLDERYGLGPARPIESRGKDFDAGDVLEGEVLDDDTFFASLRDAVRDDRPLGPRDDELGPPEAHGDLFDEDEEGEDEEDEREGRRLFRRRR